MEYEEALEGWRDSVIDALEKALTDARNGVEYKTYFNLPEPESHVDEYDAVIDQVDWNEIDIIELDLHSFNKFIRDDWSWKQDFLATNALYMKAK